MKHDKYVNNWSQEIELIGRIYSVKKVKKNKSMTNKILSRSKKIYKL